MKTVIQSFWIVVLLSINMTPGLSGQCHGYNVFTGAVSDDWNNSANWNLACVPASPISGRILIASNCSNVSNTDYTFEAGSTLEIMDGVTFTNSNLANWTIIGDFVNNGTYIRMSSEVDGQYSGNGNIIGNIVFNQTVKTGFTPCIPLIIDDFIEPDVNELGFLSLAIAFDSVQYGDDSTVDVDDIGAGLWYEFLSSGAGTCVDYSNYNYLEIKYSANNSTSSMWAAFIIPNVSCDTTYDVNETDHVTVSLTQGDENIVKIPLSDFNYLAEEAVSIVFGVNGEITLHHIAMTCE